MEGTGDKNDPKPKWRLRSLRGAAVAAYDHRWEETGGPTVIPPTRGGFGRKIIEDTMRRIGKYHIEYAPRGLKFSMEAPIEKVGWLIENTHAPLAKPQYGPSWS
jgi:two-component sensor histidine kinase